ncbi:MAG: hypothetical protein Q7S40_29965 [Opitutaceae bacterium]|nr:hypothetical protein [Opitutaceae bacterium]
MKKVALLVGLFALSAIAGWWMLRYSAPAAPKLVVAADRATTKPILRPSAAPVTAAVSPPAVAPRAKASPDLPRELTMNDVVLPGNRMFFNQGSAKDVQALIPAVFQMAGTVKPP